MQHPQTPLPDPAKPSRLLRIRDVQALTGLRRTSLYRFMARPEEQGGGFPRPVKIGPRASAWPESEVLAWIERRKAARHAA